MPIQTVGRIWSISSTWIAEGVLAPAPAQFTPTPMRWQTRALTWADRVDAERIGDMRRIARPDAGQMDAAAEAFEHELHVAEGARVEQRLAGRAAGAPVFLDVLARRDVEMRS